MVLFDQLKKLADGLAKTRDSIFGKIHRLVAAKRKIDRALLDELEEILLSADVGVTTTDKIIHGLEESAKENKYQDSGELDQMLRREILKLLHVKSESEAERKIELGDRPYVVLVVGVNGAGKTTTIGKLAYNYRKSGHKVIVGAADTFRAAANEQLDIWAKRAGVEIVKQVQGADPAAVAYDAIDSAIAQRADIVMIDTAGRLHTRVNLMEELGKIRRVINKRLPGAPHEVLLVLDASTGQNGLQQARQFTSAVAVTGLIVTKLDGTAKGGIILAIGDEMRIPVKYIGVGEQIDDLQPFDKRAFVDALFER